MKTDEIKNRIDESKTSEQANNESATIEGNQSNWNATIKGNQSNSDATIEGNQYNWNATIKGDIILLNTIIGNKDTETSKLIAEFSKGRDYKDATLTKFIEWIKAR